MHREFVSLVFIRMVAHSAKQCASSTCPTYRLHVQYKYVVRTNDGAVVRWQEGENVSLDLPGGSAAALALDVEDSWNKSKQVGWPI